MLGLRLPSIVFFLLALAGAALVARQLCGRREECLLPLLLAVAPLAVGLATFARMYTLFLALLLLVVWLLVRAARVGTRPLWIAAGACAGLLVYVHPTAPLYIALGLTTAFLCAGRPLRHSLMAAVPGLVSLAVVVLPYGYALAVLTRRYEVSSGSSLVEGSSGRPVAVETLLALTPGGWPGAAVFLALAIAGLLALLRLDRAKGSAFALWPIVPVAFFSLIPADTGFFARYVLPSTPFFLLLVIGGCFLLGRLTPAPLLAGSLLVAGLAAWQASEVVARLHDLRALGLTAAVDEAERLEPGVIFSSTGGPIGGRPAELVDRYVCLEVAEVACVEELPAVEPRFETALLELGAREVGAFLDGDNAPGRGAWLFAGTSRRVLLGERRLRQEEGLEIVRLSPTLLLVRSAANEGRDALVRRAIGVREAWLGPAGRDRWARTLIAVDRLALREDG